MTAAKPLDVAVALNGLSHIVTPDLGRDLTRDLISLLTHSRPAIRKRAVLALYKVFLRYPEAIELGLVKLKERLEDPDTGNPSLASSLTDTNIRIRSCFCDR